MENNRSVYGRYKRKMGARIILFVAREAWEKHSNEELSLST